MDAAPVCLLTFSVVEFKHIAALPAAWFQVVIQMLYVCIYV